MPRTARLWLSGGNATRGLSGRDLKDIGIAHGEIEFVASNPDIDPRGI